MAPRRPSSKAALGGPWLGAPRRPAARRTAPTRVSGAGRTRTHGRPRGAERAWRAVVGLGRPRAAEQGRAGAREGGGREGGGAGAR